VNGDGGRARHCGGWPDTVTNERRTDADCRRLTMNGPRRVALAGTARRGDDRGNALAFAILKPIHRRGVRGAALVSPAALLGAAPTR